jgi:hypothetical protein
VSVFVYIVTLTTPTEGKSMIASVARHPRHGSKVIAASASAAALDALGVLKQKPAVGIWAQGKNEGSNPTNDVANNTKPVTLLSAF